MSITSYLQNSQALRDIKRLIADPYSTEKRGFEKGALIYNTVRGGWRCVEIAERHGGEFIFHGAWYKPNGVRFIVTDLGSGTHNLRIATGQWNIDLSELEPRDGLIVLGDLVLVQEDPTAEELPEMLRRVLLASRAIANSAPRPESTSVVVAG